MKTYEFTFQDGTKLTGEGESEALALHDAYLRNGYLPTAKIDVISTVETVLDPPSPPEIENIPAAYIRKGKDRKN